MKLNRSLIIYLFKSLLTLFPVLALWTPIRGTRMPELMRGDLIFQAEGSSDFSKAITDATAANDSLKFVHVGIVDIDSHGDVFIIEASPEEGVRIVPLEVFLQNSAKINGDPAISVKRLVIDFPVDITIENANSHLGEPYDWWYLPDNDKMYCSELVYDSYVTAEGDRIFKASPMNFRAPDGSMPDFWIKLFEQLGEEVPEGVLGTNPNDLSKDPNLIEIPLE